MSSRYGYSKLPTVDPDSIASSSNYGAAANPVPDPILKKKRPKVAVPRPLKPGLFYQFGERGKYSEKAQSESDHETMELVEMKPRRAKLRRGKPKSPIGKGTSYSRSRTMLVEEPIQPGDTVQRVALRYGCRDSEIRRVNNLYRDQDFFALKTVKVPVKEHGVLSDPSAREKCRQGNSEEKGTESSGGTTTSDEIRFGGAAAYYNSEEEPSCASRDADDESDDSEGPEYRDISIQSAIRWKHTNETLLHKLDEDLQRVRDDTEKRMSNAKEVRFTMESPTLQSVVYKKNASFDNRLMSYLMDWKVLLCIIVLLGCGFGAWVGMALVYAHFQASKTP